MISDGARAALEKSELFQDIDRSKLADVAALVEECELVPDEILIRQSESALYVFVVVEGRGIAKLMVDRGWLSLGLIEPGDVAGWSFLIQAQRFPASVKVLTPMRVARIDAGRLTHLMNLQPGIGYPVHRRLSAIFHRPVRGGAKRAQYASLGSSRRALATRFLALPPRFFTTVQTPS